MPPSLSAPFILEEARGRSSVGVILPIDARSSKR